MKPKVPQLASRWKVQSRPEAVGKPVERGSGAGGDFSWATALTAQRAQKAASPHVSRPEPRRRRRMESASRSRTLQRIASSVLHDGKERGAWVYVRDRQDTVLVRPDPGGPARLSHHSGARPATHNSGKVCLRPALTCSRYERSGAK